MDERDKIIETLRASGYGYFVTHEKANADEVLNDAADALIAAGIGDTTNLTVENEVLQRDVDNLVRTLEEGAEEYEAEKHRAEVAERALNKACADIEAVRKQAVIEFAVRLKKKADSYNYDENYINRSVMYTDIDDLVTEVCGE